MSANRDTGGCYQHKWCFLSGKTRFCDQMSFGTKIIFKKWFSEITRFKHIDYETMNLCKLNTRESLNIHQ